MRKLLLLALTSLMFAFTTQPEYSIIGEVDPSYEGKEVYLYNSSLGVPLDTSIVKDGKFRFHGKFTSSTKNIALARITFGIDNPRRRAPIDIIIGEGDVIIKAGIQNDIISGTIHNNIMNEYISSVITFNKIFIKMQEEIKAKFKDDSKQAEQEIMKVYTQVYATNIHRLTDSIFNANKLNMIGAYLYPNTIQRGPVNPTPISEIKKYMQQNPYATNDARILELIKESATKNRASRGHMFIDFTARDMNDSKDVKLSEYVGKGKFVLINFWASWCGPCKIEMRNLRKLHEEFGPKGLVILSINVRDEHKKALTTIEKEQINWNKIYVPNGSDAAEGYGISGIPVCILFAPDGTILTRLARGELAVAIMNQIYNNVKGPLEKLPE